MVGDILQPTHLLFILVVALLVLGPKRLPEAGRALGRGLRDFRMAMTGEGPDPHSEIGNNTPVQAPTAPAQSPTVAAPAPVVATPAPPAEPESSVAATAQPPAEPEHVAEAEPAHTPG